MVTPKVALIAHDWSPYTGAGRCAVELGDLLSRCSAIKCVFHPQGVTGRGGPMLRLWQKVARATTTWRWLRVQRVDVAIVTTTVQSSVVIAARLAGCRVIWWCHESGVAIESPMMRLRWWIYDRLADRVVVVTPSAPPTRTKRVLIRNLLQESLVQSTANAGAVELLVLGTKCWRKGTDLLAQIIDPDRLTMDARLVIVGRDEPREDALLRSSRRALETRWGSRIDWLPPQDQSLALGRASVLLLPSRGETRPRVVEEALVNGIPVVASPLPGVFDIRSELNDADALQIVSLDEDWTPALDSLLRRGRSASNLLPEVTPASVANEWVRLIRDTAGEETAPRASDHTTDRQH